MWICTEVDGVFYESMSLAGRKFNYTPKSIKYRCLSNNFPNYKIVPFRVTYTEKACTQCGKVKVLKEFGRNDSHKDKLNCECRECVVDRGEEYRGNNPEKIKACKKEWDENNREHKKEYKKRWNEDNSKHVKEYAEEWTKGNPEYQKEYESQPPIKARRNELQIKRRKNNPIIRLHDSVSASIRQSLKGQKNGRSWEKLIGYTCEELMIHLESLFTEGMSWENYGKGKYKWNLDHVIAKCHFNITSAECQKLKDCWALKNLQPLWQTRNDEKGDRPMEPKYLIKPF